jgi:hypothetical protein
MSTGPTSISAARGGSEGARRKFFGCHAVIIELDFQKTTERFGPPMASRMPLLKDRVMVDADQEPPREDRVR